MATDIRTHTVLLRSDGLAVACGRNDFGQCDIPPLDEGASYTQGFSEVMVMLWLVATKGTDGQCNIPSLEEGTWYTQVSAGAFRTVLLRSDGCAVTRGTFSHWSKYSTRRNIMHPSFCRGRTHSASPK